jgi:hypothetical protein
VYITINEMKIPIQIIRKSNNKFLLKFRPNLAGDYLIILKDFNGQSMLGKRFIINKKFYFFFFSACPYIFPVYNLNGIHIEPFNHLQPINDCHFICMSMFFSYLIYHTFYYSH